MTTTATTPAMATRPRGAEQHITPERIVQMAWSFATPLILGAAIRHRLFDHLESGPKTAAQLSELSGASLRGVRTVVNALTGLGLLTKDGEERYSLTAESNAFLVSGRPTYFGGLIRHISSQLVPRWLSLNDIVASGKPVQSEQEAEPGAEFFAQFVEDLFPVSYPAATAFA